MRHVASARRSWQAAAKAALVVALVAATVGLTGCTSQPPASTLQPTAAPSGISKIRHVVVIIMQGNRSFDSFFGTYRGGRWPAGQERPVHRLRAGSAHTRMRQAVPRPEPGQQGRLAQPRGPASAP